MVFKGGGDEAAGQAVSEVKGGGGGHRGVQCFP